MNYWKNLFIIVIIFFSSLLTLKIPGKVNKLRIERYKNNQINNYVIKLQDCIDLENKTNRRIHESLKLIEYCIKELGID